MTTKNSKKTEALSQEKPDVSDQEKVDVLAKNDSLKSVNETLKKQVNQLERLNQALTESLMNLKRDLFGKKSEKYNDVDMQLLPFPGMQTIEEDLSETEEEKDDSTSDLDPDPKPKSKKKRRVAIIPDDIEKKVIFCEVAADERVCDCCGTQKHQITIKETERLDYQPGKFVLVIEQREVLGCSNSCEKSMVTALGKPRVMPKCKAEAGLLSHLIVTKVMDRQPLYHLEKQFKDRYNIHITRQVMADWMIKLSEQLRPLVNLMNDEVSNHDIASFDATSLQVLKEDGRKAETKSYAYCKLGGPPGKEVVIFNYNALDHQQFAVEEFDSFQGSIHVDADPFFKKLGAQPSITLSFCNSHSRRRFEKITKATNNKNGVSKFIMKKYQQLYLLEKNFKSLSNDDRMKERVLQSLPIMEEMRSYLEERFEHMSEKSSVGLATRYFLTYYEGLIQFTTHGGLFIDNNHTERMIKYFVIARKNFLFCDSMKGADSLALHFTLVYTSKRHGFEPKEYYRLVLDRLPLCKSVDDYRELLPWNLIKTIPHKG
jgi:transposase